MGVTFHAPKSVGECERMNPHTPKWAPTLRVGVPMDFWIFRVQFQRSKLIELKSSLHHWKDLEALISKMGLHDPFEYLKHKLWPKKRLGVKLPIWLQTTKSRKCPYLLTFRWHVAYHWKTLDEGYNFFQTSFQSKVYTKSYGPPKSWESPFREFQLGSLGIKWYLGAGPVDRHKEYFKGEDGGSPSPGNGQSC